MATWNFAGSGFWTVGSNWSPVGVPTSGDVVLDYSLLGGFNSSYIVTIAAIDPAIVIDSLTMDSLSATTTLTLTLLGSLTINSGFIANGLGSRIIQSGGTFVGNTLTYGANVNSQLIWTMGNSASVTFSGLITDPGATFQFGDASANKVLMGTQGDSFSGSMSQFQGSNSIDLTGIAFTDGVFTATQAANGKSLLIFHDSVLVFTFGQFRFLNGSVAGLQFSDDGSGNLKLTVCFAAGTRILTDRGEIAVERLLEGDAVVTLDGSTHPVRWIGRRRLFLRTHPNARAVAPVRIRAGAFADGMPHRDLVVSPDHAVFAGGGLVPARQLINQMSIRQEMDRASVEYFHVELDQHAILMAEGLATESYLDTGNRGFFSNSGEPLILHPDGEPNASSQSVACAPFLTDEASVRPIWQLLHDRALASGLATQTMATTQDAGLRLLAGGREFLPLTVQDGRYVFALPAGTDAVRLVSRSAAPADWSPWLDDRCRLGVAIERIALRSQDGLNEVAMDAPSLSQGWWSSERCGTRLQRWTDGDAVIDLPGGPVLLELEVSGTTTYPLGPQAEAQREAA